MRWIALSCSVMFALALTGCTSGGGAKPGTTGFLSDYSNLKLDRGTSHRYFPDGALEPYHAWIVEPVDVYSYTGADTDREALRDLADYFDVKFREIVSETSSLTETPGDGVGRIRIAVTDVTEAVWFLNLHPAMKLTGIGRGAMGVEIEGVDSLSGEQVFAIVETARGNQFEFDHFDSMDDARDAIDKWAAETKKRLEESNGTAGT